ncbi:MAG TPA: VCBS repeat-containing protein [Terriglobales bacterium]|nr:VCBS repeat-containing protein [Terriglobales bacterium]
MNVRLSIASLLFCLFPVSLAAQCFNPATVYVDLTSYPAGIAVADFNHDGRLDIAVAGINNSSTGQGSIEVLPGNGDGTFGTPFIYASTELYGTVDLAAGDFDNDGNLDLLAVGFFSPGNSVSLFLGNGDGTFRLATSTNTSLALYSVAVGDFDEDGNLDAVVSTYNAKSIGVIFGNGDGTLSGPLRYPNGGRNPWKVRIADFNRDGHLDISIVNSGSYLLVPTVSIHLGNGDGTFTPAGNFTTKGSEAFSQAIGDFNEDGIPDIAVADTNSQDVGIAIGRGDGTFAHPVLYPVAYPWDIAASDVNRDGHLDLVTIYPGNPPSVPAQVSVQLGNGDGTFQAPIVDKNLPSNSDRIVLADLNGDGSPDFVSTDGLAKIAVGLNTGHCP